MKSRTIDIQRILLFCTPKR